MPKFSLFVLLFGYCLSVQAPHITVAERESQIMRQLSQEGYGLITQHEGLRLQAYQDSGGIWTIGYGHTGADVNPGQVITKLEALTLLQADLKRTENFVEQLVTAPVNDKQFAALVSFAFNVGVGNFERSTLLEKLNKGDYSGAAQEFLKWTHVDGQVLQGLKDRRLAEQALFIDVANRRSEA